jgi:NAD(P)H-nitrite reductase large subunit
MARRHVLIGVGPGSIAAAEEIRHADEGAEITLVGIEPEGYYSRPGLAYYITRELPESRLFPFTARDFARLRVTILADRAVAVDPTARRVTLESGRELVYDRLLMATGSQAVAAKAPGADLDGVVKLDHMDDARDLIRRCRDVGTAVVVGGGITALEIVEGIRARGVRVHYLMRQERYWRNVLSESESRIVEEALLREGVRLHHFTELAGIHGSDGRVAAVETADGSTIPCGLVAVAIGVRPRKELAEAAGVACDRGVLVDEHLRSNHPDVFAAGDLAEAWHEETGRRTLEVLWNAAVAEGRVAGRNMATEAVHPYEKSVPLNITRLAGVKTTIIGTVGNGEDRDLQSITRGNSETWSELGDAALVEVQSGRAHVRLALAEGVIVGALIMGDQALSFPLQELIEAQADIGAMAGSLQEPGAPVAELVTTLWRDWGARRD